MGTRMTRIERMYTDSVLSAKICLIRVIRVPILRLDQKLKTTRVS
jgi:hypothetical protein